MKRELKDCLAARRHISHQHNLDAVRRSWLDLHLKRCEACWDVAQGFEAIEAGFGEVDEIDDAARQAIYTKLVPVVHEITNAGPAPSGVKKFFELKYAFAFSASVAVAALVFVAAFATKSVETEKITYEVEAPSTGLLHIVVAAEEEVPVAELIGIIAADKAELDSVAAGGAAPSAAAPAAEAAAPAAGAAPLTA